MLVDGGLQLGGDLLTGARADRRPHQMHGLQLRQAVLHALGELERRGGIEAQRLGRNAVQLAAVGVERRRAHRRQHQRGRLDRRRFAAQPIVDDALAQQPAGGGHAVEHRVRIDRLVRRLRQLGATRGEELLADGGIPGEGRQHPHRLGHVVQDRRHTTVPIVMVPTHRRTLPQPSTFRRRDRRGSAEAARPHRACAAPRHPATGRGTPNRCRSGTARRCECRCGTRRCRRAGRPRGWRARC